MPEPSTSHHDQPGPLRHSSAQKASAVLEALEVGRGLVAGNPPAERITLLAPELVTRNTVGSYEGW